MQISRRDYGLVNVLIKAQACGTKEIEGENPQQFI
jgi:hypothetical protein